MDGAREVFAVFLRLGLTSFGGPVAHLGYFREEFVARRGWLSDQAYADLVALCQFLPGPASSQVGFAIGLMRAGWLGALAAFVAFTLPSALALFVFATAAANLSGPVAAGALHGLKVVAVAIVAHALWGMARSLCPDAARATIAVAAVVLVGAVPGGAGMIAAILAGALAGVVTLRAGDAPVGGHVPLPVRPGQGLAALAVFLLLLVLTPLLAGLGPVPAVFDAFFRAGALVFGGGHVVLPLLEAEIVAPGWVSQEAFVTGYGAAQAVPGPLFSFAAYLGAVLMPGGHAVMGAVLAVVALFLPGFLILVALLPFWDRLRAFGPARASMQGANAAVVGILGGALYAPVFTTAIRGSGDFALALGCFVTLAVWRLPPLAVVGIAATGGVVLGLIG
jgi:chromate transporter